MQIHEGDAGRRLWLDCVKMGIEARKALLKSCTMIRPFLPMQVNGTKWQDNPTDEMANDLAFFNFHPNEKWHSFPGYAENQYFVDPCKLMLTTPGINTDTGEYEDFGIPATILANYLRENGIIPEKCDLNSILFLLTPAETPAKLQNLVSQIARFEHAIQNNAPLRDVLPSVYQSNTARYEGYTIRRLCQEMHDFYKKHDVKRLQQNLFRKKTFPKYAISPQEAQWNLIRNNAELVPLTDIVGRIGLEGALPYPPGIICVVPGEIWNDTTQQYFLTLEEGINLFPGFSPEIQGVYLQQDGSRIRSYGYVLKKA